LNRLDTPISIPIEETRISLGKIFWVGRDFRILPTGVIRVTNAIKTPTTLRALEEHAITAGIWLAIGNAMQYDMDINTWTKRFVQAFSASALNYFVYQEIESFGVFAMKECRSNPNLISDFDLGKNLAFHESSMRCHNILTKYYNKFKVPVERDL
jgi:hypothetical protein